MNIVKNFVCICVAQNSVGEGGSGAVAALPQSVQQARALGGHPQSTDQGSEVVVTTTAEENKLGAEVAGESERELTHRSTFPFPSSPQFVGGKGASACIVEESEVDMANKVQTS